MSSLRLRQKMARREQMLEAARALFVANGYAKTSIEAIAEAAEVGVASIYTYFETKEGLTAALIHKDIGQTIEEADRLFAGLPDDPAEAVMKILNIFIDFNKYISAELLREFIIQAKVNGPVAEALAWGHQCQIKSVAQVLTFGQASGKVAGSLDLELAAALIVDLMDRHMSRMTNAANPQVYAGQLEAFVRLLFTDWVGPITELR